MDAHLFFKELPSEVIENNSITISLYQTKSLLLLEWKHQISFVERKRGFLQALALTNHFHIKNWIVSDRYIFFISSQEKKWLLTDWIEKVSQSPLLKLAVVAPEDYNYVISNIGFTSEGQKQYQAKGEIDYRVFLDFSGAFSWVLSSQEKLQER